MVSQPLREAHENYHSQQCRKANSFQETGAFGCSRTIAGSLEVSNERLTRDGALRPEPNLSI
jgi:hypothetical protein